MREAEFGFILRWCNPEPGHRECSREEAIIIYDHLGARPIELKLQMPSVWWAWVPCCAFEAGLPAEGGTACLILDKGTGRWVLTSQSLRCSAWMHPFSFLLSRHGAGRAMTGGGERDCSSSVPLEDMLPTLLWTSRSRQESVMLWHHF